MVTQVRFTSAPLKPVKVADLESGIRAEVKSKVCGQIQMHYTSGSLVVRGMHLSNNFHSTIESSLLYFM